MQSGTQLRTLSHLSPRSEYIALCLKPRRLTFRLDLPLTRGGVAHDPGNPDKRSKQPRSDQGRKVGIAELNFRWHLIRPEHTLVGPIFLICDGQKLVSHSPGWQCHRRLGSVSVYRAQARMNGNTEI
jgi:hypothetical protein